MNKIYNPDGFVQAIAASLVPVQSAHLEDLLQVGAIKLWQLGQKPDLPEYVSYRWKAVRRTMVSYLQKWHHCRVVRRPDYHPQSPRDPAQQVEDREFRDTAIRYLLEHSSSPEQGSRDVAVCLLLLGGNSYGEIAERCPWLQDADSVAKALVRIVVCLRQRFGADEMAPIELRSHSSKETRTHDNRAYQAEWYAKNRERRVQAAIQNRRRRKLHDGLLALGYSRYGEGASGLSSYYVHHDGFRVRVSDHPCRSPENLARIATGEMYLVDVCQDLQLAKTLAAIEAARSERSHFNANS